MLIVVFGVDGSGKSSYIDFLETHFKKLKKSTKRIDPMQNGLLVSKLKYYALEHNINDISKFYPPSVVSECYALDMLLNINLNNRTKNEIIISHRYDICCKVYGNISGANVGILDKLCSTLPKPDLWIYIDIEPKIAMNRILENRNVLSWKENVQMIEKAKKIYSYYLQLIPKEKLIILNNNVASNQMDDNYNYLACKIGELLHIDDKL